MKLIKITVTLALKCNYLLLRLFGLLNLLLLQLFYYQIQIITIVFTLVINYSGPKL